jgi:hypothetical protein
MKKKIDMPVSAAHFIPTSTITQITQQKETL